MYTPEAVLIYAGINDVLNYKSRSNTENILSNIKYMVGKCRKFCAKNILISGLVFTTNVSLEVLEKIHEKLSTSCSGYGLIYILIIKTSERYTFVKTIFIYYNQVRRFYVIILFHI